MLVFDQLKKNEPQLQLLAIVIAGCLAVLLVGLWWVQVVRARDYTTSMETQTYRTVRLQSVRGKILDRNGDVLAENRASFDICIYLEDLRDEFRAEYRKLRPTTVVTNSRVFWRQLLGMSELRTNAAKLTELQSSNLVWDSRCQVVNRIVRQLADTLAEPGLQLNTNKFKRHHATRRALPFPVLENATPAQIAKFSEQLDGKIAADLEVQSTRAYPHGASAAHLIGYVRRDSEPRDDEERDYFHRMQDFRGVVGIEGFYESELRGLPGTKSVLVNSLGYRQSERIIEPTEPGKNVVLTIDSRLQQAGERSLRTRLGPNARGAIVVLEVQSGDVLALVSSPAADPNYFISGFPTNEVARWSDPELGVQKSKATYEQYQPGSIFKTIVGLAALENGLNPEATYRVQPDPANPAHGCIFVGRLKKQDTAPPGDYDFKRALFKSSNSYFITNGTHVAGIDKIAELARRLHLGEKIGLPTMQEAAGNFPSARDLRSGWTEGNTANICIGQGEMDVTPLQMAVMTAALANGGRVLYPRLVDRLESQDPTSVTPPEVEPKGRVRDQLGVRAANLKLLHEAMLADTENPEATAYKAFQARNRNAGATRIMRVCGKTGTAQKKDEHGRPADKITWFISFAPFEQPKYAVVVMVEDGGSGGGTCAPIAAEVYSALDKLEAGGTPRAIARNN